MTLEIGNHIKGIKIIGRLVYLDDNGQAVVKQEKNNKLKIVSQNDITVDSDWAGRFARNQISKWPKWKQDLVRVVLK